MADIVVYGGSFAAAAAASKAADNAPNKSVVVIIPDPVTSSGSSFGSIGTIGGQNCFDIRNWTKNGITDNPIKGSFSWWYSTQKQFYNTDQMAAQIKNDVTKYSNVTVYYGYDIQGVSTANNPFRITQVSIRNINRNSSGVVVWGSSTKTISGSVFIDASDDGRLARVSNFGGTVGRYDWPANYLDSDERGTSGKARQQAATLMFKVTGVEYGASGNMTWGTPYGVRYCAGGWNEYKTDPVIVNFNNTYGPQGYALKPMNAAQNGSGSDEWWINALLVFNVDGRAYNRDRGTTMFPSDMRSDYKTVDDAWVQARNFIKNNPAFMSALRHFPGFSNAQLVLDSSGNPEVGKVLYLRETIHLAKNSANRANGTENSNYQLTTNACNKAGSSPSTGQDSGNYSNRIGLNYYWSDINAYKFEDMKNASGQYIWGSDIGAKLRPDLGITSSTPTNPVYVPYQALLTGYVANLLVPGYAANISSFGWAESRVIPNLCVMGDAAGVVAARAATLGKHPLNFTSNDMTAVQSTLRSYSVRLDK